MFKHWHENTSLPSREEIDNEIKILVKYEEERGLSTSISLNDLRAIGKEYYKIGDLKTEVVDSPDGIKRIIASGSPVIVGAAGKALPNPNFRNGGPNYHMLLVKGYDEKGFITNDPGTRRGENYYYTNSQLFDAIHDWDPKNILQGSKVVLYQEKNSIGQSDL